MKSAVCLLVLWAGSVRAAEMISQVQVLGAPAAIELQSRAGEPLDPAKLQHDVKALWQSGRVADVTAETVPDGDAVQLVFRARPRASLEVRKVQVEPLTPGINLGVDPGAEIDSQEAQRVAASVRKQLESSGFPNAVVGSRLVPVGDGKADLKIDVNKGQELNIEGVTFSGNLGVREPEVRARFACHQEHDHGAPHTGDLEGLAIAARLQPGRRRV